MTKENLTTAIVTLIALVLAIVAVFIPTEAGTIANIVTNFGLPFLFALVAIFFPAGKALAAYGKSRAQGEYYKALRSGAIKQPPRAGASSQAQSQLDALYKEIYADLDADGISYHNADGSIDPIPVGPRLLQELTRIWNDPAYTQAYKQLLLNEVLKVTSDAYTKGTGLPAPTTYAECADYNKYWREHQVGCEVHSAEIFRQLLMPIREALKIKDTGEI
jgi:hypothetical protein